MLRGWANYFRHGVSKATFGYLDYFTWRRVVVLAPQQATPGQLEVAPPPLPPQVVADGRRGDIVQPGRVTVTRYRYRGAAHPVAMGEHDNRVGRMTDWHGLVESRMRGNAHVRFGGRAGETDRAERSAPRPGPTPTISTCAWRRNGCVVW